MDATASLPSVIALFLLFIVYIFDVYKGIIVNSRQRYPPSPSNVNKISRVSAIFQLYQSFLQISPHSFEHFTYCEAARIEFIQFRFDYPFKPVSLENASNVVLGKASRFCCDGSVVSLRDRATINSETFFTFSKVARIGVANSALIIYKRLCHLRTRQT